jgi:F-type H+-transporting ATPase subunit a
MGELGKIYQLIIPVLGHDITINLEVVVMTWIVFAILIALGLFASYKRQILPRPIQTLGELIVSILYGLTEDALGKELAKTYAPLICALFMFLLLCNWIGLIPHFEEPTKDLNTTLGLGIMGFFFMMPLNVIGEIAKIVSISFRLFGNIMGGAIIILVVSYLTYSLILPPFLYAFFGLFVGTIQAFVFTMLTVVYISVQVK